MKILDSQNKPHTQADTNIVLPHPLQNNIDHMHKNQEMTQCSLFAVEASAPAKKKKAKVSNSAVASTLATFYHLYLAVQHCFKMKRNDKVYIETYGDITLKDKKQIEVKCYDGNLTDSHLNLWNTLKNWMDDSFDPLPYSSLILNTTQPYGPNASISKLNDSTSEQKFEILKQIYDSALKSHHQAKENELKKDKQKKITKPQSLKFQEKVFETSKRYKLKSILDRFCIITNSPNFPNLCDEICDRDLKHIPKGNREDLLNALVGFVVKPTKKHDTWDITFDEFSKKVEELNPMFIRRNVLFPALSTSPDISQIKNTQPHRFSEKIKEIEYDAVLNEAFSDYCYAMDVMKMEIYQAVPTERHLSYFNQIEKRIKIAHRISCRDVEGCNLPKIIKESKRFYDERMLEESPQFKGFDDRPEPEFRNGVIHILFDEKKKQLTWLLK